MQLSYSLMKPRLKSSQFSQNSLYLSIYHLLNFCPAYSLILKACAVPWKLPVFFLMNLILTSDLSINPQCLATLHLFVPLPLLSRIEEGRKLWFLNATKPSLFKVSSWRYHRSHTISIFTFSKPQPFPKIHSPYLGNGHTCTFKGKIRAFVLRQIWDLHLVALSPWGS